MRRSFYFNAILVFDIFLTKNRTVSKFFLAAIEKYVGL